MNFSMCLFHAPTYYMCYNVLFQKHLKMNLNQVFINQTTFYLPKLTTKLRNAAIVMLVNVMLVLCFLNRILDIDVVIVKKI
jgi:hypothetical protein